MLYCFQSHSSLVLEMVIKWFPVFVNMWALSCMICMVGWVVFMSVSGLHSFRFIWIISRCSGSCMYLVSFDKGCPASERLLDADADVSDVRGSPWMSAGQHAVRPSTRRSAVANVRHDVRMAGRV
jgi:hypothetical protein